MTVRASAGLGGVVVAPGDKSISHRALMLAGLAVGMSRITGLLESDDIFATIAALRQMGPRIERSADGWEVSGVGVGGLLQPAGALDLGNSGTAARLIAGMIASHAITATLIGDASLSRRPMDRIIAPLRKMGAEIVAAPGDRLPMTIRGRCPALPLAYRLPLPSAQVKSAILFAALNAPGVSRVIEPVPTRDHSEQLLKRFGADIGFGLSDAGERSIAIAGEADLKPQDIAIPGDASSAAFPLVAALIVPGSRLTIANVGLSPTRAALFELLREMGGDIRIEPCLVDGEPIAGLDVRHSALSGVELAPARAASLIDEFPIFFVAAAFAKGRTIVRGVGELRHKESDRIAAMAAGLTAIGARVEELEDSLIIDGSDGEPLAGGAAVSAFGDHRVAMSLAVAGLHCRKPMIIDDMRSVATSYPEFAEMLGRIAW